MEKNITQNGLKYKIIGCLDLYGFLYNRIN